MHPTFHLGPLDFPAYFTFLTFGYLLVVMLAWRETFRTTGVDPNKLLDLSIVVLIAGLVGARIMHVIADGYFQDYVNLCLDPLSVKGKALRGGLACVSDEQCVSLKLGELCHPDAGTCHQGRDCFRAIKIWYGGLAFYGGLLLAWAVGAWYIHRHRASLAFWKVADLAGFGIAGGLVFGRLGCWFSGCCFGHVTQGACGVVFPKGSPAWDRHLDLHLIERAAAGPLPVIPTQLIHVASNLFIFALCYGLFKLWRRRSDGQVFWVFMFLYAVSRFVIEYWRDDYRGVWLGGALSSSQLIAVPVALAALGFFFVRSRAQRADATTGVTDTRETDE